MADNVLVTAGSGTSIAADEVVDGTLGTVKVQYVKLMDGTLDGTTKAAVGANGLKVDGSGATQPVSGTVTANAGTGTFATSAAQSGNWSVRAQDGSGNSLSSDLRGTKQALSVEIVDSSGNQITSFGGAGGTASNVNSAIPTSATAAGFSDGTNMQLARVFDADSGAGTQYVEGVMLRGSASGGSIELGNSTNPLQVSLANTAANSTAVKVDGSAVTQPVSMAALPLPTGASTSAIQSETHGTVAAGTAATKSELIGGVFNTVAPTLTNGQQAAAQFDSSGNLKVNIIAGAGSGGTAVADEATFTQGTTSFTPIGGTYNTSIINLTSGQAGAVQLSNDRKLLTKAQVWDGTNAVTIKAGGSGSASNSTDAAIVVTVRDANANGQATMANSAPVVIASDQSAVKVSPQAVATGGATPAHYLSAASTNATSTKVSAGTLYGFTAINTTATVYYLKFYNKASAPTVGTDTPVLTYPVPASTSGAGLHISYPVGVAFGTGIAWALTGAAADADTTSAATGVTISMVYG